MSSPEDAPPGPETTGTEDTPTGDATAAGATGDGAAAEAAAVEPSDPTDVSASSDEIRKRVVATLKEELGDAVVGAHIRDGDDLWVRIAPEAWREAGLAARNKLDCTLFVFLSAIDWQPSVWGRSENDQFDEPDESDVDLTPEPGYAGGDTRFQVFARVHSPRRKIGLTLKVDVADPVAGLPSWIPVYWGANWHERETWEMFGIGFSGHPNLTHVYLPGDFEGHPLRKDFPLMAREVKPWPGIVDVEPMPEEPGGGDSAGGESATGGGDSGSGGEGDESASEEATA